MDNVQEILKRLYSISWASVQVDDQLEGMKVTELVYDIEEQFSKQEAIRLLLYFIQVQGLIIQTDFSEEDNPFRGMEKFEHVKDVIKHYPTQEWREAKQGYSISKNPNYKGTGNFLQKTIDSWKQVLDENEALIQAFDKIRAEFEGRHWLMEGRGCYPYDDERYKEEVRCIMDRFNEISKELWSNIKSKTFEYRNQIEANLLAKLPTEEQIYQMAWDQYPDKGLARSLYERIAYKKALETIVNILKTNK